MEEDGAGSTELTNENGESVGENEATTQELGTVAVSERRKSAQLGKPLPRINGLEEVLAASVGTFPEDVISVAKILKSGGVKDCEPAVLNQLLEFMHRYVCEVLADSLLFCEHAGRRDAIQPEDVQLAIKYRVDHAFSGFAQPPSIDFLREMAQDINIIRLPAINKRFGVMLPPDHFCLNETNYQVVTSKKSTGSTSVPSSSAMDTDTEPGAQTFLEEVAKLTTPRPTPPRSTSQIPINLQSTITSVASGLPAALPLNFNT